MKTVWFLQETKTEDNIAQRIMYAAQELGMEVHVGKHIPFSDPDLSFLPSDKPVLFHGGISCAESVQRRKLPLYPFAWFDFEKLCCHHYYAHYGEYLATPSYAIYPFSEILRLKDWIYKTFSEDDCVFFRPNTNDKVFVGDVVTYKDFDLHWNWRWIEEKNPEALVVAAKPVNLDAEWRLFLAEGKVIAGSQYKEGRNVIIKDKHYPDEAAKFAEEVAAKWSPHPFFCIDIGLTYWGYRVIECGSANCAGFYSSDVKKIVKYMSIVAEKDFMNYK